MRQLIRANVRPTNSINYIYFATSSSLQDNYPANFRSARCVLAGDQNDRDDPQLECVSQDELDDWYNR